MKTTDRIPALVRFAPGGCHIEFFPYGNVSHSCLSGYETPENFFQRNKARDFEGIPFIITSHMEESPALIEGAVNGPMLDTSLPPCHMRPCLGNAVPWKHGDPEPGALGYLSTDLFIAMWKRLGAITGIIRKGSLVPDPA